MALNRISAEPYFMYYKTKHCAISSKGVRGLVPPPRPLRAQNESLTRSRHTALRLLSMLGICSVRYRQSGNTGPAHALSCTPSLIGCLRNAATTFSTPFQSPARAVFTALPLVRFCSAIHVYTWYFATCPYIAIRQPQVHRRPSPGPCFP